MFYCPLCLTDGWKSEFFVLYFLPEVKFYFTLIEVNNHLLRGLKQIELNHEQQFFVVVIMFCICFTLFFFFCTS